MRKEFMSPRSTDWKTNANKRRTRSIAGQTLIQIFEIYDDKSLAAHLISLIRSKGVVVGQNKDGSPKYRDFYYLKDEEVLKILESYREELDVDALESAQIAKKDGLTD